MRIVLAVVAFVALATAARAEDGYDLWLRYRPLDKAAQAPYRTVGASVVTGGHSATTQVTRDELVRGLSGLLARNVKAENAVRGNGAILFGTPANSPTIASLKLPLDQAGPEGFVLRNAVVKGHKVIVIAGNSDAGVLYGAFAFLRLIQTGQPIAKLDIVSAPKIQLRMLDHWDNVDRTIERGFAGFSIFNWWELPWHVRT